MQEDINLRRIKPLQLLRAAKKSNRGFRSFFSLQGKCSCVVNLSTYKHMQESNCSVISFEIKGWPISSWQWLQENIPLGFI